MRDETGFTIVEALVAMAILSVALVVLYGIGADLLIVSSHISAGDRAALYTQSKLETLALVPTPLPAHEEGMEDGFHWQFTTQSVSADAPWQRLVMQDVQLVVTWQSGAHERSLTATTRHLGRRSP